MSQIRDLPSVQTFKQRDRQTYYPNERQRNKDWPKEKQIDRQTDRQTDRQSNGQTDGQTRNMSKNNL